MGASRMSLAMQFFGEALLFSLVALVVAVVIVQAVLTFTPINSLMDGKVKLDDPAKKFCPGLGVPPDTNAQTGWLDKITLRMLATQTAGGQEILSLSSCDSIRAKNHGWLLAPLGAVPAERMAFSKTSR